MAKNTSPPVKLDGFITDARHAIAVAGLLAAKPELLEAEHTVAEWTELLDAYLATPMPAPGGVQVEVDVVDAVETDTAV